MYYIVDRIEAGIVILQSYDKTNLEVSTECFDFEVKEGDVVKRQNDKFFKDENETMLRRERIKSLSKKLFSE